jgi:hypothetical protein
MVRKVQVHRLLANTSRGVLCGSSYINERFQDLITNRLRDEDYLRREGEDFSRVIDRLVVEFERVDKLVLDNMFPDHIETYYLKVEGLKRNKPKHFRTDLMRLSKQVAFRKKPT